MVTSLNLEYFAISLKFTTMPLNLKDIFVAQPFLSSFSD